MGKPRIVIVGAGFADYHAARRLTRAAAQALAHADVGWLQSLITRRVPLGSFAEALTARDDDIKVVIDLADGGR